MSVMLLSLSLRPQDDASLRNALFFQLWQPLWRSSNHPCSMIAGVVHDFQRIGAAGEL
jgi:hypothetical protein